MQEPDLLYATHCHWINNILDTELILNFRFSIKLRNNYLFEQHLFTEFYLFFLENKVGLPNFMFFKLFTCILYFTLDPVKLIRKHTNLSCLCVSHTMESYISLHWTRHNLTNAHGEKGPAQRFCAQQQGWFVYRHDLHMLHNIDIPHD